MKNAFREFSRDGKEGNQAPPYIRDSFQAEYPTLTRPLLRPQLIYPSPRASRSGQQKTRLANQAGFGSASGEAYLRRNFVLNFSTRPAESTKRFSPV
jgi:hypothetical protein